MNLRNKTVTLGSRQNGAALVVGLILLLVLTILAVSGVMTSMLELRMAGNTQLQERAFQAAEVAVEDALANPLLTTGPMAPQILVPVPNAPDDQYEFRMQYVGETQLGSGLTGYSIGTGFLSFHFEVDAQGRAPGGATARHTQAFYIIGPGGT